MMKKKSSTDEDTCRASEVPKLKRRKSRRINGKKNGTLVFISIQQVIIPSITRGTLPGSLFGIRITQKNVASLSVESNK
ncbi:hypothetical protein TNCT_599821 [Trichonephila clavata]|uniref:Uncharacterized protein n=1 Tax=Trichonephila clavata TaxID=2740835 RepID=A0A8X6FS73_TRICU|nr:hypothetical protein TNCT_599821 [Trichonephila clavata]